MIVYDLSLIATFILLSFITAFIFFVAFYHYFGLILIDLMMNELLNDMVGYI